MKKIKIGLKEGILIDVTILLVSALLLLGFTQLKITEHLLIKQQSQTAQSYISSIQSSVTYMYQTNRSQSFSKLVQSPALRVMLDAYRDREQFSEIIIVDKDLNISYSSERQSLPAKFSKDDFKPQVWQGTTKIEINKKGFLPWFFNDESSMKIYSPIYFGTEIKAAIMGKIPLSHLKIELTKMRGLIFIYIAVDAAVFILFGWFMLSKRVVRPVRKLINATEEVSKGTFSHRIEMDNEYNEVNALAQSFNRMTERLSEKTEDLKKTVEKLTQTNKELQTAQDSLVRSAKLATTGRLAAGLAHEIGNPLGSITSYLEYLLKEKNISEKNKDCLARVEKEIGRIDEIVREFLDLASPTRGVIKKFDLDKAISNSLSLLKHRKDFRNIKIDLHLSKKLPQIKVDEQKFQQVLFNILLNAADAISDEGDSGKITVTGKVLDQKKIEISVQDNGTGIEKENIQKIFDPFFTTKDPGKGTGLGLSICQKIISDMDGEIIVDSKPGKGTTFKIALPFNKH